MKKHISAPLKLIALISAFFAMILCVALGVSGKNYANAAPNYENYLSAYKTEFDIRTDRSMTVTTDITAVFNDPLYNTGVYMYIPVNAGELVRNVTVKEVTNAGVTNVYHEVSGSGDFVLVDIGDDNSKYRESHTYRIVYDYCLTDVTEKEINKIALTPVGSGWTCDIQNIEITMLLPEGYISGSAICYENSSAGKVYDLTVAQTQRDGRVCLTAYLSQMSAGREIRFDMDFEQGVLTRYSEFEPWIFVILACVVLGAAIIIKLLLFKKPVYTPVVNFDAPSDMNPLYMGKLIDGKVDNEDITSMIFYWADKGYVKINLDDKDDPSVIRIRQQLPEESADYEKLLYNNMFAKGDVFKPSAIAGSFYNTVNTVRSTVNSKTKNLYNSASIAVCAVLGIIAALLCGLAPIIIALTMISGSFFPVYSIVAAIAPLAITCCVAIFSLYYELKNKNKGLLINTGITIAVTLVSLLFYVFAISNVLLPLSVRIVLTLLNCATQLVAATIPQRSKNYVQHLNGILGFKNFITLAEKDRLEKMIEDDPQFYYHVLPYAQVLGVSDIWEEKFENITMQPPAWATGSVFDTMVNIHITRSIIRSASACMRKNMIAPPAVSGKSGGFNFSSGGGFGGFSGGGHGGGGGGFR